MAIERVAVAGSLTLSDALRALREDVQAENALIAGRVTWYVTSQAFLLTAYATSWNGGFGWQAFFHQVLPWCGVALSGLILASVVAATWAQDVYLREQAALVARIRASQGLSAPEGMALEAYERTMVANRTDAAGRLVGRRIHALVRITPIVMPIVFSLIWLYAYCFAPMRPAEGGTAAAVVTELISACSPMFAARPVPADRDGTSACRCRRWCLGCGPAEGCRRG